MRGFQPLHFRTLSPLIDSFFSTASVEPVPQLPCVQAPLVYVLRDRDRGMGTLEIPDIGPPSTTP